MLWTYEFAKERKPCLQDRDHAELSSGVKYRRKGDRELVVLVRERVEFVAKAWSEKNNAV